MVCLKCKVFLLLCLLCLGGVDSKFGVQTLDTDLDETPSCIDCKVIPHTIIDIHSSMKLGAQLLNGFFFSSLENCVAKCQSTASCDMTLFKENGVSKSGKNCYFIGCGDFSNCVMVSHGGFTSVEMLLEKGATTSATTTTPVTTPTTTPTSSVPTSPRDNFPETSSASPPPGERTAAPSTSPATTFTDAHMTTPLGSDASELELPDSTSPPPPPPPQGPGGDARVRVAVEDCSAYGCNGSGIVAVVIVGVICFAVVILVGAVLIKRIVKERRKKKFRNVDYLINGMYT